MSQTALGDVAGLVGGLWGELAVQPILMRMSIDNLCALNPDDPGPPTPSDLEATANFITPFAGSSLSGQMPTWLLKELQYHYFGISCRCINVAETIPPRQIVSTPPGNPPYPTDHDSQPQLKRIENNQLAPTDPLVNLYRGLQRTQVMTGDGWAAWAPQAQTNPAVLQTGCTGEGTIQLPDRGVPGNDQAGTLISNIWTHVRQLPSKVGIRGTLNPRLYGVGSFHWLVDANKTGRPITYGRESIHYYQQVFDTPRLVVPYELGYRLMPGSIVDFYWLAYGQNDFRFNPGSNNEFDYWVPFWSTAWPPGWNDHPFAPPATRRLYALGSPP